MISSLVFVGGVTALALMAPLTPSPAQPGPQPVVTALGMFVDQVSHDGRFVQGELSDVVLDRQAGTTSAPACTDPACWSVGFVRDNPVLQVVVARGQRQIRRDEDWYRRGPLAGVYLVNTGTGSRIRIDTDSAGVPLVPSWSDDRPCGNEWCDSFYEVPDVFVSSESVSRDGREVAFCTNYAEPKVPVLHVKDTVTGVLTRTSLRCPIVDTSESLYTHPPQISANGRVVHVNGDVAAGSTSDVWSADQLYFARSRESRVVPGWGSMTRDGRTIFMRLGVRRTPTKPARIAVGAYSIPTRRVIRIGGGDVIYGNPVRGFSSFDSASYRGRFVVARALIWVGHTSTDSRITVVDRQSGASTDIAALLRHAGYEPSQDEWSPSISGDGKVVIAVIRKQVATTEEDSRESVAITGWEPTARAAVAANAKGSKLIVNVDPDKGSGFWTFRVQAERADGSWRTLKKTYRTRGQHETRTIDLPAGTYRVRVKAKYGYQGSTSAEVVLVR